MKHNIIDSNTNFAEYLQQLFYKNNNEKSILQQKLNSILSNQHFQAGLDIGAGPGLISQPLYEHCDDLTLLEVTADYKNILKEKYPKANVVINSFLDFNSDKKFDLILCSHVLYYFNNLQLELTLAKMRGLLKPEGLLLIILMDCSELLHYFSAKLSSLFGVNFIAIKPFTEKLKKYGRIESVAYQTEKLFDHENEFIDYLYNFFALKNEQDLLNCQQEINQAKQILKKHKNYFTLHQNGEILLFKQ